MRKKIILAAAALVLLLGGIAVAAVIRANDRPSGALDTDLEGVSVSTASETVPGESTVAETTTDEQPADEKPDEEGPCWLTFGGNPQRTFARTELRLGKPVRPTVWARGMKDVMEYPPSFCDGKLYVNLERGKTVALDAKTGRIIWTRKAAGATASTPAIAGPILVVSSHDGSVSGLARSNGKRLWRVQTGGKVESSPVVLDDTAYFASTDGRVFAANVKTGAIRWAYNAGGRMNSSPSIYGNRLLRRRTYTGAVFCLRRDNGQKLWSTYVKRDVLRYESFYASASTDGARLYTTSRAGKVVAFRHRTGRVIWTQQMGPLGYATPAIAYGRVYVRLVRRDHVRISRHRWSSSCGGASWAAGSTRRR